MVRRERPQARMTTRRPHQEDQESGHEQDTVHSRMFSTADFERGDNPALPIFAGKLAWFGMHRRAVTGNIPGDAQVTDEVD